MRKTKMKKNKKSKNKKIAKAPRKKTRSLPKEIESSYARKKQQIDKELQDLEREQLSNYLTLVENQRFIITTKKKKLHELKTNISKNSRHVKDRIAKLKKKKIMEKIHFDKLYAWNEYLKRLETQIADIILSRKTLIKKEKYLLSELKKFFKANHEELVRYGLQRVKRFNAIIDKKDRILAETVHILNQDSASLFEDKRLLETITDGQLDKVSSINQQLKKLEEKHRQLLIKVQELKTEDFEIEHASNELKNKKATLLRELKKPGEGHSKNINLK